MEPKESIDPNYDSLPVERTLGIEWDQERCLPVQDSLKATPMYKKRNAVDD